LPVLRREKGMSVYKAKGQSLAAVHRSCAHLFRLALEKAPAAAPAYHGVAEEGIAFRDIAAVIGKAPERAGGIQTTRSSSRTFWLVCTFCRTGLPGLGQTNAGKPGNGAPCSPGLSQTWTATVTFRCNSSALNKKK